MPTAFSLTYGLDMETEAASFWSWFRDVRDVLQGGEGSKQVRDLVDSQREQIESILAGEADSEQARLILTVGLALLGHQYASQQKLLNGLKELGVLDHGSARPVFDTIMEPPVDEDLRPR